MFLALWIFFIILNGKVNLEIILIGLVTAAIGTLFACLVLGWDAKREKNRILLLPRAVMYGFLLLWNIMKSNFDVVKRIYSGKEQKPAIVKIPRKFKAEWKTVLEANSITLTPGTITMRLADDDLTVHCLDRSLADGLIDSDFEKAIAKMGDDEV